MPGIELRLPRILHTTMLLLHYDGDTVTRTYAMLFLQVAIDRRLARVVLRYSVSVVECLPSAVMIPIARFPLAFVSPP